MSGRDVGTLYFSALSTETNSFSNLPTTYESFAVGLLRGEDVVREQGAVRPELAQVHQFAEQRGLRLVGGIRASAEPSAPVQQAAWERLRDELLDRLAAEEDDVRAVVLSLHGAMVATDCEDCEGDLLERVRRIVGPGVPVGAVLDPHAHLTPRMVAAADLLIFMKEYPHIDGAERTAELLDLLGRRLDGAPRLRSVLVDCELLGFFPTDRGPMRDYVNQLHECETEPDIASVSFVHGFPWGDTSETGAKVLVYTSGSREGAEQLALSLARRARELAPAALPALVSVDEAMELCSASRDGALVLGDGADNPGGGAPSDSTFLLSALLDCGIQNVALGLLHDPIAVELCHQVGVGGRMHLRVGGKLGRFSGPPLDLDVEIMGLCTDAWMDVAPGARFPMGDTAWIRSAGVDVVLSSGRMQMYAPDGFAHIGINPSERDVLVAKSSNHYRAFFGDVAAEMVDVATPGAIQFDFSSLPYRILRAPRSPRVAESSPRVQQR